MFKEFIEETNYLTKAARQGRLELQQVQKYENARREADFIEQSDKDIQYQIIEENEDYYLRILLKNLYEGIYRSKEYLILDEFSNRIESIYRDNINYILRMIVQYGVYGIYDALTELAGSASDFQEGVDNAREAIGASEPGSKGWSKNRSYWFWRNKVWGHEELYMPNIRVRLETWGNLAPYWYFLEHGNYHYQYAYPQFPATKFASKAAFEIMDSLDYILAERRAEERKASEAEQKIEEEYIQYKLNLFDRAVLQLEENPKGFPDNYIWGTYTSMENQRKYKVYLTRTGKVGRRLVR